MEIDTGCPGRKPVPQLLTARTKIEPLTPLDRSEVTVTLFPPAIQLLPVETFERLTIRMVAGIHKL